jgi:hypothetical protein
VTFKIAECGEYSANVLVSRVRVAGTIVERERKLGKREEGERVITVGKEYSSDNMGDGPPRRRRAPRASVVSPPIVSDVGVGNQMVLDLLVAVGFIKVDCAEGVTDDNRSTLVSRVEDVYTRSKPVISSHREGSVIMDEDYLVELDGLKGELLKLYEQITGRAIDGFDPGDEGMWTWEDMKDMKLPRKEWMAVKKQAEQLEANLLKKMERKRLKAAKKENANIDEVLFELSMYTFIVFFYILT